MENVVTKYITEIVNCPTCNGKGTTTFYSPSSISSTSNSYNTHNCKTCEGKGKLEKIIVTTEIYRILS